MFSPRYSNLGKLALSIALMLLAGVVLSLSLVKAGWEMAFQKRLGDELREVTVSTETIENGDVRKSCYRFPEGRVLPGNVTYNIKLWRDWLWWHYAPEGMAKAKTAHLLADKRMMEAVRLMQEDPDNPEIWETTQKAVDWLNQALEYLKSVDNRQAEKEFLEDRLEEAVLTYKSLIISFSKKCTNGVQYMELTNKLKYSNEETKKNPPKVGFPGTI